MGSGSKEGSAEERAGRHEVTLRDIRTITLRQLFS